MQTAAIVKVIARVFCFLASRKPSAMKHNSKFKGSKTEVHHRCQQRFQKKSQFPCFTLKLLMLRTLKHQALQTDFYKWISVENSYILYSSHVMQKYFKPFSGLLLMIETWIWVQSPYSWHSQTFICPYDAHWHLPHGWCAQKAGCYIQAK